MIIDPYGNPLDYIDALNDRRENLAIRLAVCGEWDDAATVLVQQRQKEFKETEALLASLVRAIHQYQRLALSMRNCIDRQ